MTFYFVKLLDMLETTQRNKYRESDFLKYQNYPRVMKTMVVSNNRWLGQNVILKNKYNSDHRRSHLESHQVYMPDSSTRNDCQGCLQQEKPTKKLNFRAVRGCNGYEKLKLLLPLGQYADCPRYVDLVGAKLKRRKNFKFHLLIDVEC